MKRIRLKNGPELSAVVHGQMRMTSWNRTPGELLAFMEQLIGMGITTFDHADIYGNYACEALLGDVLKRAPGLRNRIEIITKCGIKLLSDKFPGRMVKHYDYSYDHIVSSVNKSLENFGTDRIDLLLLHRPAPFFDPEEAARAFSFLKRQGKVLHFGVSNFTPAQYEMLSAFTDVPLVTNQVEISPYCLEHFDNGNIDFFMKERIRPMAWSPLGGGRLISPEDERGHRILQALRDVAQELGTGTVEKTAYAWLFSHPAGILPVVGSGRVERIREAVEAMAFRMNLEQWYRIWSASTGCPVA